MRKRLAIAAGAAGVAGLLLLGIAVTGDGVETVTSGGPSPPGTFFRSGETTTATTMPPATTPPTSSVTTAAPTTTTPPPPTTTRRPVTTTTRPPAPPTTTTTAPGPGSVLRKGATGAQVRLLQQRLTELGYWLATVDGAFGDATFLAHSQSMARVVTRAQP